MVVLVHAGSTDVLTGIRILALWRRRWRRRWGGFRSGRLREATGVVVRTEALVPPPVARFVERDAFTSLVAAQRVVTGVDMDVVR